MVGRLSGRASSGRRAKGLLETRVVDIRDFAEGKHRVTDDVPYGGGAGW
jgi:tRNA (guanine37-N1)-methyltransferase